MKWDKYNKFNKWNLPSGDAPKTVSLKAADVPRKTRKRVAGAVAPSSVGRKTKA